jgi:hypothetical protein
VIALEETCVDYWAVGSGAQYWSVRGTTLVRRTHCCEVFGRSVEWECRVRPRSTPQFTCDESDTSCSVIKSVLGEITDESNQAQAFSFLPLAWALGCVVGYVSPCTSPALADSIAAPSSVDSSQIQPNTTLTRSLRASPSSRRIPTLCHASSEPSSRLSELSLESSS